MKRRSFLALLATTIGLVSTVSPNSLSAQSVDTEICISIYPCLDSGDIDPRFDVTGLCGDKWRTQCADVRAGIISEKFNSCAVENESLRIQTEKLTAQQKKLQKTLRKLKRAK